jgi:GTP cyclohydrolase I
MINQAEIRAAVTAIIKAIGENPDREGLKDTPRRVAEMYTELFAGLDMNPRKELTIGFEEGHRELVILRDIPFHSMCEHHLLPFYGVVHIGYLPNASGRVVGASKLARVVEIFAKRPQIQERMTTQIADTIVDSLQPDGVGVIVQAEHLCMIMRGIKKPGSAIVTSALRGVLRNRKEPRAEFFSLLQGK